ncbi:MAG: hypothetical protein QOH60_1965 [Mycobacterium sp.]|nr:hypothetical protein [Mycobacterium sp.]
MVPELADLRKQPAVLVVAGAAATVAGGAMATYRAVESLPLVGSWLRRGRSELTRRGEDAIARSTEPIKTLISTVVVDMVKLVLEQLDLTELVLDELDMDAVIGRIDLVGLANQVIDGVDLPAIIRESTNSVTAEVMTDVRTQGERADDMVSGFVDRILGRDPDNR